MNYYPSPWNMIRNSDSNVVQLSRSSKQWIFYHLDGRQIKHVAWQLSSVTASYQHKKFDISFKNCERNNGGCHKAFFLSYFRHVQVIRVTSTSYTCPTYKHTIDTYIVKRAVYRRYNDKVDSKSEVRHEKGFLTTCEHWLPAYCNSVIMWVDVSFLSGFV